jgi:hypothetical protein
VLKFRILFGNLDGFIPFVFVESRNVNAADESKLATLLGGQGLNQDLTVALFGIEQIEISIFEWVQKGLSLVAALQIPHISMIVLI